MTHDDESGTGDEPSNSASKSRRKRVRRGAPKERVLHTRVPAVLEDELKRLAKNLRVPVSNVVRAILEDAVDAVDTVGEVAEGELLGFVDRLSAQRDQLRDRVTKRPTPAPVERANRPAAEPAERAPCPSDAGDALDGVFGFQPLVLAAASTCGVCGMKLEAGTSVHRALFDDPSRRVFLGPECLLLPEKE